MFSLQSVITVYTLRTWLESPQLRSQSHALKATIKEKFENNFCQSIQKQFGEEKREKHWQLQNIGTGNYALEPKRKRTKLTIAKLFALNMNATNFDASKASQENDNPEISELS